MDVLRAVGAKLVHCKLRRIKLHYIKLHIRQVSASK